MSKKLQKLISILETIDCVPLWEIKTLKIINTDKITNEDNFVSSCAIAGISISPDRLQNKELEKFLLNLHPDEVYLSPLVKKLFFEDEFKPSPSYTSTQHTKR